MASFLQKKLGELAGFGDARLLPPAEYLSQDDDCMGCQDPCTEHKEYPSYLSINQDMPILGSVKPYGRHILIATGASDWSKSIEDDPDSFAASLDRVTKSKQAWKNLVTNTNAVSTYSTLDGACDVLLFPDNLLVANVTQAKAQDFYDLFVNIPLPSGPVDLNQIMQDERIGEMKVLTCPYKNLLLLCSHRKRDKRCGVTAPILAQEIDHVLREKGLDEYDAAVLMVSHIGGHKFAGNVVCYTHQGTKGIWYGRVKTCHVAAIVEETVIQGKFTMSLFQTIRQTATLFRSTYVWSRSMSNVTIVPKDDVVSQLVNTIMRDGKKARAQRLVSDSMKQLEKKVGEEKDPYGILREAIEAAAPLLKISSTKKGSKVVHVPTALRERQRRRRAIVWMLEASSKRSEKSFEERFAGEVWDVTEGTSGVLQKKLQVHKQALANRANAQVSYGQR